MSDETGLWRIGRHYGIHVYACTRADGEPSDNDRPVATFHRPEDASAAVEAHNDQVRGARA